VRNFRKLGLLIPSVAEWTPGLRALIQASVVAGISPGFKAQASEASAWLAAPCNGRMADTQNPASDRVLPTPSPSQLQTPSTLAKEVKSNLLDLSHLRPSDYLSDALGFDPMPIKFLLDKAPVNKLIPATSLL